MDINQLSLFAVFLTGLLGGVHCAGMCGGIVSALGMMQQKALPSIKGVGVTVALSTAAPALAGTGAVAGKSPSPLRNVALYNIGRITIYTLLGAIAGAVGSLAWLMQSVLPIQKTAYLISSLLFMLMGLYVMGFKRFAVLVEALGSGLWKRVRPVATRRLGRSGTINSLATGFLWGLVPCGMVYAVLSSALVSGSAFHGALLMFVFGLGTLPNLMALGLSGQWLARASKRLWLRRCVGLMIMMFGLLGLMHVVMMGSS